jgi:hypothetical protein
VVSVAVMSASRTASHLYVGAARELPEDDIQTGSIQEPLIYVMPAGADRAKAAQQTFTKKPLNESVFCRSGFNPTVILLG